MSSDSGSDENKYDDMKNSLMEVVGSHFRPEFINRVDDVVVFHPLGQSQIRSITGIQMEYLKHRLADREMSVTITDAALDFLGLAGYDPVYGARPLKRAIQSSIENPLAHEILSGKFISGDTIVIDSKDDELVFDKATKMTETDPVKDNAFA